MATVDSLLALAKTGAFVVPRPDLATLVARGKDRVGWLNGLVTCDVTKAAVGRGIYGLATTQKGRILADVIVVPRADELVLVVPAGAREALAAAFDKYIVMEDVELSSGDESVSLACGAAASELHAEGIEAFSFDALGLGGAVLLSRSPGALSAMRDVTTVDEASFEALRVALAVPRFGVDFDQTTYPQEASLEKRAVSFDKGCYLGQEVVCMLEMRGHVKRKLVPVAIESGAPVAGAALKDESGAEVGTLTSVAGGFGLAMLKLGKTALGTSLVVGDAKATVRAAS